MAGIQYPGLPRNIHLPPNDIITPTSPISSTPWLPTRSNSPTRQAFSSSNRPQRPRFTYTEPPPVPPSQDQHKSRQTPNHVPIIITDELKAAVQRALPHSPDTGDGLWRQQEPTYSLYSRRGSSSTRKPKHIPIRIPDFAQPYNPFPPSPPPSSGVRTPQDAARLSTAEEVCLPMRSAAAPAGAPRPSTADSNASTPEFQQPNDYGANTLQPPEGQLEASYHSDIRPRPGPETQSYNVNESISTATAQQSLSGATNLSGLMCNMYRCSGKEPHGLVGATTTIVSDKLYVFGGKRLSRRKPQLTSDLYELDLIRRHWTRLETTGDIPTPRYFHSMCAVGDTKMICYGGMSPAPRDSQQASGPANDSDQPTEVIVMSDVHLYDIASHTWELIRPTKPGPQGRYAHCATVLPSSAVFSSAQAPRSAIKHNPSSTNPNEGSLGYTIDGTGGAEMIVVGGQDSANSYIEQISVFNLRSMEWTSTQPLGRSCGAYRSVVAPLASMSSSQIGDGLESREDSKQSQTSYSGPASMLIYSNYNFLDVKLELQVRQSDGSLVERPMTRLNTPPGLRFPSGGVVDGHFLISGTFLTSSKQEYALWALNLRTLTWTRVDAGNSIFSQGSWNRGILWPRKNTFVILGNRKRNLIEDYNHRRINFTNICLVELEAFGYYDNPRRMHPSSSYISASAPAIPQSVRSKLQGVTAGGRPHFYAAEELGLQANNMRELADMDIECMTGERIPANSHILSRRWGPYFVHAMRNGAAGSTADSTEENADTATLKAPGSAASRNSAVTITPSMQTAYTSTTLAGSTKSADSAAAFYPPTSINLVPSSRSRTLYLPHSKLTVDALLHYLYTSGLPPINTNLSTPQILCSLLQIARPYCIEGLLEAVVERLHQVTDGRTAPAVFNASAMAAGGGRSTAKIYGNVPVCEDAISESDSSTSNTNGASKPKTARPNGSASNQAASDSSDDNSSVHSEESASENERLRTPELPAEEEIWNGDLSCVIGLQKRGLRGLMEGRRLRERGQSVGVNRSQTEML